jgi:hypothetical protein
VERFWSHVDKSGECWLWTGYKTPQGYGRYAAYWEDGKQNTTAHRFAYQLQFGELDPALELDHTCYVKACVNPAHLRPVTSKQNKENRSGPQKNNKSGVLGVCWNSSSRKWQASVRHHKKSYYLGLYDRIEDAEAAVVAKRLEFFTHNDRDRL